MVSLLYVLDQRHNRVAKDSGLYIARGASVRKSSVGVCILSREMGPDVWCRVYDATNCTLDTLLPYSDLRTLLVFR